MVSKVVPKGSQTSQTSILNPNWLPNAAQSDVLGIIFRRLWIVGALLSFLFLASLLGCWGSQWSYKRYYKAHGSSNAHATTAHYHQKNVRVGGMRRQPLKLIQIGPILIWYYVGTRSEPLGEGKGDDGNGGRIFPEHPSPILHAPRDNISCKGKSLTPTFRSDAE